MGDVGGGATLRIPRRGGDALGYEQVSILGQHHGILAGPHARDVGDDFAVKLQAAAQAGRGMAEEAAFQGEGQLVGAGRELLDLYGIGLPVQWEG